MEQMNYSDGFTMEFSAIGFPRLVCEFIIPLYVKYVHSDAFSQKDLTFGRIWSIGLIIHPDPLWRLKIVHGNDKENSFAIFVLGFAYISKAECYF